MKCSNNTTEYYKYNWFTVVKGVNWNTAFNWHHIARDMSVQGKKKKKYYLSVYVTLIAIILMWECDNPLRPVNPLMLMLLPSTDGVLIK